MVGRIGDPLSGPRPQGFEAAIRYPAQAIDKRQMSLYELAIRHRGLGRHYEDDERRELNPQQADKIVRILARLDQATEPSHLDLPGWRLHPLKGDLAGYWSITVSGNWRVIFRFEQGEATDVDLLDYH